MDLNKLGLDSKEYILVATSNLEGVGFGDDGGLTLSNMKVLAAKDAEKEVPVASLTKIMTAMVTLENRELTDEITITYPMTQGLYEYVIAGLNPGQVATVEDLLYALLLPSAGDAAQALAIEIGGSISGFAEMMNKKAAELGLKHTHFSNPVGMDEENYSSAADMAVVLNTALKNTTFKTIFETYEKYLPSVNMTVKKTFYQRELILGGKSGYTNAAGRCLASTAEIEGTSYILITLGADPYSNNHVADTEKIYAEVEENYEPVVLLNSGDLLKTLEVKDSETKTYDVIMRDSVTRTLPASVKTEDLRYEYDGVNEIVSGTLQGDKLGTYNIYNGENLIYSTEILLDTEIEFYNYFLMFGVPALGVLGVILLLWVRKQIRKFRYRR